MNLNVSQLRNSFLSGILLLGSASFVSAQCPTAGAVITKAHTDISCFGADDGTITVELGDGDAPMNFELYDNVQGAFIIPSDPDGIAKDVDPDGDGNFRKVTFSRLYASSFQVVVFKSGCTTISISEGFAGIVISQPTPVQIGPINTQDVTCKGRNDGEILVTSGTGGSGGPYEYSIDGGATFQTVKTFSTLFAGVYEVVVRDGAGCTSPASQVTVSSPPAIVIDAVSSVNLSCNGSNDGQIVVTTVSGGDGGPYEYSIDNGTAFQPGNTFTGLAPATYNVVVRDGNGCLSAATQVIVSEPVVVTIDAITSQNSTCNGAGDGQIVVTTVSGGDGGPYEYSIDNGGTFQALNTFSGLTPATYDIVIRDGNGCLSASTQVIIGEPAIVTIDAATSQNVTCNGAGDGQIVVTTVSGGDGGPYGYSIDNGAAFQAGNTFTGLAPATYDIVVRDGSGCLSASTQVVVSEPVIVTIDAVTSQNATCNGAGDGQIVVTTVSGGDGGAYEYSIDNGAAFQVANTFTGLAPAMYDVVVRDGNGCLSASTLIIISEPALVTIDAVTSQNSRCNGADDGQIVVTNVTGGGGGPYEYSIDNGATFQAGNTFNGLPPATYNLVVQDGNGCVSAPMPVVISEPLVVSIDAITSQNVTCNGAGDGQIAVTTVSGGDGGPYEYSSDNGVTFQAGNTFNGLAPATYDVVIRDGNGCLSASTRVIISQPAVLTIDAVTSQNVTCNGAGDGQIVVSTVSGGDGGTYQYSSDNGVTFQAGNTFNGLAPATYDIAVRDGNGCLSASTQVIISEPTVLAIDAVSSQNVTCNGAGDGQIVVTTASGGDGGPYEYSIDNGAVFQAGNTFSGLVPATYNVVVRDGAGCLSAPTQIIISEPAVVSIDAVTSQNLTCNGAGDGQIVATTVSGGAGGPYEYSIDNGAVFQAGNTFTGLVPATYNVVVRDGGGCLSAPTQVIISEPAVVSVDGVTSQHVTCNGANDGKIVVATVSGGDGGPYEYSVDNGAVFQAGNTFTGLVPATYDILVRDASGCVSGATPVLITQPPVLAIASITVTDATCNGVNDGLIQINSVTGGTPPYQYSMDGGLNFQINNSFASLGPGNYDVTVRDKNGCTSPVSVVALNAPVSVSITGTDVTDASCLGTSDGAIEITTVTGGTQPYQYSSDGGATFQPDNIISQLAPGGFDLVVRDDNGCESSVVTVTIDAATAINIASFNADDASCAGIADGSIDITSVTGGVTPYVYSIDAGASFQASGLFSALAGGDYDVVVRDVNGCLSAVSVIAVGNTTVITLTGSSVTDASCAGSNDGSIEITGVTGGTAPHEYALNGGGFQSGAVFPSLPGGDYEVQIRDANGCLSSPATIAVNNAVSISGVVSAEDVSCGGGTDGRIEISSVTGGAGPYTYSTDGGVTYQSSNIFSSLPAGNYNVVVRDANGCGSTAQAVTIRNGTITFNILKTDATCAGNDGSITVSMVSGGTGIYEYAIDGGTVFGGADTFSNLAVGNYSIIVRDDAGCLSAATGETIGVPSGCGGSGCNLYTVGTTKTRPTCANQNDGSISFTVSGGTPGYIFTLSDNAGFSQSVPGPGPDFTFSNLSPANYFYTIQDNAGNTCTLPFSLPLESSVTATAVKNSFQDVQCHGSATGSAILDASGSRTGEYYYSIDGSAWIPFLPGSRIQNLPPNGTYDLLVGESEGDVCRDTARVVINNAYPPISVDFDITPATCNGNDGAIINLVASGGKDAPFTYSIDGGVTYQPVADFYGLAGGSYTLRVRDASSCERDFPANITFPGYVDFDFVPANADCQSNKGSIKVSVDNPGQFKVALVTDPSVTPTEEQYRVPLNENNPVFFGNLPGGSYFLLVKTNESTCPTQAGPIVIKDYQPINFDLQTDCSGNQLSLGLVNITGDASGPQLQIKVFKKMSTDAPDLFNRTFPGNGELYLAHNESAFLQMPGAYQIKVVQVQKLSETEYCDLSSETVNFTVPTPLAAQVVFVAESYPDIPTGDLRVSTISGGIYPFDVRIKLDSAASFSIPYYQTDFEEAGLNANQQVEMRYDNVPAGRYHVEVMDSLGCTVDLTARVPLDIDLFIPNVFTPNGDGPNEVFFIRNLPMEQGPNELIITNRWGKQVFVSENYQNNWGAEDVADGIYFYKLKVGQKDTRTGWVEIIRGQKP